MTGSHRTRNPAGEWDLCPGCAVCDSEERKALAVWHLLKWVGTKTTRTGTRSE